MELAGLEPGDPLGAIPSLPGLEFRLVDRFPGSHRRSPNTFPNNLRSLLQNVGVTSKAAIRPLGRIEGSKPSLPFPAESCPPARLRGGG